MSRIQEIYNGWKNHLAPPEELKELIQLTSDHRLSICTPCEFNSTPNRVKAWSRCKSCGCPLLQKSKSLQSKCPVGKWGPVTTAEEEHTIKLAINGEANSQKSSTMEASNRN